MLEKVYGADKLTSSPERKYSPAECVGSKKTLISGNPDMKHVSTSYMERSNLSIRMQNRRFTRSASTSLFITSAAFIRPFALRLDERLSSS